MVKSKQKYDEKEDKVLSEIKMEVEGKAGFKFEGKIRQYKSGPKKLQISRIVAGDYGFMYSKLGRLDVWDMKCIERLLKWGQEKLVELKDSSNIQEESIESIEN